MSAKTKINLQNFLIVAGPQGYGKSWLIRYIMLANRDKFSYGLVFTNTSFSDDSFDYVPQQFVHPEYNEEALVKLMDIQEDLALRKKEGEIEEIPNAYLIFDDCLFDGQFKSKPFKRLMTQLRHYHIFCIISAQYPNAIPSMFRANAFQVAMFSTAQERALKALYENYGQLFKNYRQFKDFLLDNTGNYQFIFYEARGTSTKVADRYRVMKAPATIRKFMLKVNTSIN
jgi:hypothetical protein